MAIYCSGGRRSRDSMASSATSVCEARRSRSSSPAIVGGCPTKWRGTPQGASSWNCVRDWHRPAPDRPLSGRSASPPTSERAPQSVGDHRQTGEEKHQQQHVRCSGAAVARDAVRKEDQSRKGQGHHNGGDKRGQAHPTSIVERPLGGASHRPSHRPRCVSHGGAVPAARCQSRLGSRLGATFGCPFRLVSWSRPSAPVTPRVQRLRCQSQERTRPAPAVPVTRADSHESGQSRTKYCPAPGHAAQCQSRNLNRARQPRPAPSGPSPSAVPSGQERSAKTPPRRGARRTRSPWWARE